ncbi:DNA polymerase III subunit gamma/tau [bacterium]|nr:DNA polymerase III subunit gamma/tau [bacterium]
MPKVLYNKYRSADFDQVIGQEHITKILKNAVRSNKIAHAYLFVGSRGTGKTSTARILAKALNCQKLSSEGNPCCECEPCLAITQGRFLDLIEIDAASNRGIDQIRELKEKLEFSPVEGKYKIYIVDEVHMLTKEAFNALLKTLEEPPAHVIFILATTDVHKLPPTILSRCQRYDFRLGSEAEIGDVLSNVAKNEGVKMEEGALKVLIENAHGSFRDGLSLLDVVVSGQLNSEKPEVVTEAEVRKILGIPDETMVYHLLENLVKGHGGKVLELVEELESKGVNLHQFIKYSLITLETILIRKIKNEWKNDEYSFANHLNSVEVNSLINIFLAAEKNLRNAVIPSLIIEMLIPQVSSLNNVVVHKTEQVDISVSQKAKPQATESKKNVAKVTEAQEETEEEDSDGHSNKDISFEQITKEWNKVIEGIRPANGHLFAFLGGAKLLDFVNSCLRLEVPFEFHKDRIETPNSRESIRKVVKDVFGTSFKVECVVNGQVKRKKQVSADVILQNAPSKGNSTRPVEVGPRKVSKKIEAIFAGM